VRVLLVDDSTAIQRSFGALLATAPGVEVVGYADDLATAKTAIASSQPELMVLDAMLRGKDRGIDVLRHVRQNHPGIKVVMISQFNWTAMRSIHLEAGALAYFDKSTEFQQARDFIAELSNAQAASSKAAFKS
jgi:two-component system, NarL family, response regulator DevR